MRANDGTRTGGEILIDQLVVHGVQHVFCVPGESYLAAATFGAQALVILMSPAVSLARQPDMVGEPGQALRAC